MTCAMPLLCSDPVFRGILYGVCIGGPTGPWADGSCAGDLRREPHDLNQRERAGRCCAVAAMSPCTTGTFCSRFVVGSVHPRPYFVSHAQQEYFADLLLCCGVQP